MSSATGAVLLLVAGLGSMGYVTYRTVTAGKTTAQEIRHEIRQDRPMVHVRFVTHPTEAELIATLRRLRVEYVPTALATKIALSETLCEIHVLDRPKDAVTHSDEFVAAQVATCREMVSEFKGKAVVY